MSDTPSITPPTTMQAMVTMGHGDMDQMVFHTDWPCPTPAAGQVLVKVGACGLNNTDVNTRAGWYSKAVSTATKAGGHDKIDDADPSWGGAPISFPRIQGADICGRIVAVGAGVDRARIGQRILSDCWLRDPDAPTDKNKTGYMGSECDGGFAQYTVMPEQNAIAVNSALSDAELATFSCSYSTAEGMLSRAELSETDTILIPGASGGVGSALVQLAKHRGARVLAMTSPDKEAALLALGADRVLPRATLSPNDAHNGSDNHSGNHSGGAGLETSLKEALEIEKITVLADVVGGPAWPYLLDYLQRGGRYTCSGAIAGPMAELDLRTLYLRDLTFTGSTVIGLEIMPRLVSYIEAGVVKPLLAATYPLAELHAAQRAFMAKKHIGNIVVCP